MDQKLKAGGDSIIFSPQWYLVFY